MALVVAGAIVVVGSLFGVGVVTGDVATRRALAEVKPIDCSRTSALARELGLAVRRRGSGAQRSGRGLSALGQVSLAELAEIFPDALSGGERARVALARALAADPELLVLDEPTSALDRASAAAVIELLTHLDPSMTVVVATHDRDLIAAASDRLDLRDVRRARRRPQGDGRDRGLTQASLLRRATMLSRTQ